MATKNRDVELGITVTTAGSEGVKQLKDEVDALAKAGGDAAPEFQALSSQLDRLGAQAKALEAFDAVRQDIDALSLAQNSAAIATDKLAVELNQAVTAANSFRASENLIRNELLSSQDALSKARIALAEYKNENKLASGTTDAYKLKVQELSANIINLRREIVDKAEALRNAKKATTEAEVEETRLEQAFGRSEKQSRQATAALREREVALRESLNTLDGLGIQTDNLTQSEIGLVNALVNAREEVDRVTEAQRRAAEATKAQAQNEELRAEQARQNAADYTRWWEEALYRREQAEHQANLAQKATAEEAQRTGQAIRDALGTVGVRTAEELRAEITRVKEALQLLKTSGTLAGSELDTAMAVGQRRIKSLERDIREVTGTMTLMDRVSKGLNNTFVQFAGMFTAVEVVQRLGRAFFDATKQIETLRLGLGQIYGSATVASSQIDFLRRSADNAGIAFGAISDSFVKFSAATKSANIPLEQTNALFTAVTKAAGTLGLSGDKVNRALEALGQIASKGVVSMEELRQQLGDSLPGALSLTAKGLGLTDAQLIKLVESGGLLARDMFPALTKALASMQGEVNTTSAAWERFKNFITTTFQTMGDSGVVDVLKGSIYALGLVIGPVVIGLNAIIEAVATAIRGAAVFAGTLAGGGGLKDALGAVGSEFEKSIDRQAALANSYQKLIGATDDTTGKVAEQTAAVVALTTEQKATIGTIQQQTAATITQGIATEAAGNKASLSGKNWNQLRIQLDELAKTQENQILSSEKLAKAKETEGKNSVEVAKMIGDEAEIRMAATKATIDSAAALQAVSTLRDKSLAQQIAYRDALLDEIARLGDADGARLKSLEPINQRINLLTAEAERARQSATESSLHAQAVAIESAKLLDNSARLEELTAARTQNQVALAALNQLEREGINVTDAKVKLTAEATRTEALYRDALDDVAAAANRKIATIKSEYDVTLAKLGLEKASLEAERASAIARGDTARATQIAIQLKDTEIKIARAKAEATAAEAKATLAAVEADRAALAASGQLTDAKKAEIDARIAAAKVKQLESQASLEHIKIMEQEVYNLRVYGDSALDAGVKFAQLSANLYGAANAFGAVGSAAREAAASVDASGRVIEKGRVGNTGPVDNSGMFIARDKLEAGTLTTQDLPMVRAAIQAAKTNFEMMQRNPSAFSLDGQTDARAWFNVAQRLEAAASALETSERKKNEPSVQPQTTVTGPTLATAPAVANTQVATATKIIRIEMGGTSANIALASEADATTLQNVLQQLAGAKRVAL